MQLLAKKEELSFPNYHDKSKLVNDIGGFFVRKIDRLLQTSIQECAMRYLTASLRLSVSPLRSPVRWTLVVGCLDVLLPVISRIINLSLSSGHFSDEWKEALVIPILKKPGLDPTQMNNLLPVGNLHFISKLTKRAVFDQIHSHMSRFALYLNPTILLPKGSQHRYQVQNDILMNMNCKHVSLLVLDLSTAVDTVDGIILFARLKSSIGIN